MSSDLKTTIPITAKGQFTQPPVLEETTLLTFTGAEQFTQLFYRNIDGQRAQLRAFYRPTSTILWNGNAFIGGDAYTDFMARFPATSHEVNSFDCHPVDSAMLSGVPIPGEPPSMILVVSGSVRYGEERERRGFSESFLLKADGDVFYVANHVNRLIYKSS
jgi:NTF2-related export protein 1/2